MKSEHFGVGSLSSEPLHSLLRDGEAIVHVTGARVIEPARFSNGGWTITVTDQRVLCTREESAGRRVKETERASIQSVRNIRKPFGGAKVIIVSQERSIVLDQLTVSAASALAAAILRKPAVAVTAAPSEGISLSSHEAMLDRIDRLEAEVEELRAQVRFLEAMGPRRNELAGK